MRISDWSSDVCSSDLRTTELFDGWLRIADQLQFARDPALLDSLAIGCEFVAFTTRCYGGESSFGGQHARFHRGVTALDRSEEHTSELQSLMRISYAVFCLKKKITSNNTEYQPTINQ